MLRGAFALLVFLCSTSGDASAQSSAEWAAQHVASMKRRGEALADSVRQVLAGPPRSFAAYVALENVILGERDAFDASAELQFRRLLLVGRAESVRDLRDSSALETAWRLAHDPFLKQNSFGIGSTQRPGPYWDIFDKNPNAPWSEELAWHAAQLRPDFDECYANCVMDGLIINAVMQYWIRLPSGQRIDSALIRASEHAKYAAGLACLDGDKKPDGEYGFAPALVERIRSSLTAVTSPHKAVLLRHLAEGEAKCRKVQPSQPKLQ